MLPHSRVHGRSDNQRTARAQGERSDQVVGAAVCEARQHVGRRRNNGDKVRAFGQSDVNFSGDRFVPHVRGDRFAGHPGKCHRADEACSRLGHHGKNDRPRLSEEPCELDRLVGRDASRNAKRDRAPRTGATLRPRAAQKVFHKSVNLAHSDDKPTALARRLLSGCG